VKFTWFITYYVIENVIFNNKTLEICNFIWILNPRLERLGVILWWAYYSNIFENIVKVEILGPREYNA
jgi:hypothetical protein